MFFYIFLTCQQKNEYFSFFLAQRLVVTATDRGSPRLAGSATLTVIIVDQNDNSPTIPLPQEVRIPESKYIISKNVHSHFAF